MVFPRQDLTVIDPGIGVTEPTPNTPTYVGVSQGGSSPINTLISVGQLGQVRELLGFGDLAEDVALALSERGGPVYAVRTAMTIVPMVDAPLNTTGTGPAITANGNGFQSGQFQVSIIVGGDLGAARFSFSIDNTTQGAVRTIPISGTYSVPNSAIVLTFAAGTYVAGDKYEIGISTPTPSVIQITDALEEIALTLTPLVTISGLRSDAADGVDVAVALGNFLQAQTQNYIFARGITDIGGFDDEDNVLLVSDDWVDERIVPCYGLVSRASVLPYEGFFVRLCSASSGIAARAARELISTDLSRTASGPDRGVFGILFDGFLDQRLDAAKISTMRTWPGIPGFYIANAKLHSAFGSDFTDLQFGRIMDVACRTVFSAQFPYIGEGFRSVTASEATPERPVGSIDPKEAADVEASVLNALSDNLLRPNNARGRPGHVSDVFYEIDPMHNIVTTQSIKTAVGIQPLGYAKVFLTELFFSLGGQ